MKKANNLSGFVLKKKYQNIPLHFGSPILVNNENMTVEYGEKLLERKNGKDLFESLPEVKAPKTPVTTKEPVTPKTPVTTKAPLTPKDLVEDDIKLEVVEDDVITPIV